MRTLNHKYKRVAVLYGGQSAEREISLLSGDAIGRGLAKAGYDVEMFDTQERPLTELCTLNIDKVFIALHGRGGEDGTLQGALTLLDIPFTGSDVLGSALAMDKVRSKFIFDSLGLPTPAYSVVSRSSLSSTSCEAIMQELGPVVMVKPSNEGSSIGMSQASTAEALFAALSDAFIYDENALVETWITGREFTVSIVNEKTLPVIELCTPDTLFYDYKAKYQLPTTEYHCPASISEPLREQLQQLALDAFNAVGAKNWGRVDFLVDENEHPFLLEVNTVPGMTEKSLVPMAAKANQMSFSELVVNILEY